MRRSGAARRARSDRAPVQRGPAATPAASDTPRPRHACPLCGGPNACAPAQSGRFATRCWCETASFAPTLLARAASVASGAACICQRCAAIAAACDTLTVAQRGPALDAVGSAAAPPP